MFRKLSCYWTQYPKYPKKKTRFWSIGNLHSCILTLIGNCAKNMASVAIGDFLRERGLWCMQSFTFEIVEQPNVHVQENHNITSTFRDKQIVKTLGETWIFCATLCEKYNFALQRERVNWLSYASALIRWSAGQYSVVNLIVTSTLVVCEWYSGPSLAIMNRLNCVDVD